MLDPIACVFFLFSLVPLAVGSFAMSNIHHDNPCGFLIGAWTP
jgi:hypothetical protein